LSLLPFLSNVAEPSRAAIYGKSRRIRVDQGPEFASKGVDLWAWKNGVIMDFSRPANPGGSGQGLSKRRDPTRPPR
jgi:transposase InsO family protein